MEQEPDQECEEVKKRPKRKRPLPNPERIKNRDPNVRHRDPQVKTR